MLLTLTIQIQKNGVLNKPNKEINSIIDEWMKINCPFYTEIKGNDKEPIPSVFTPNDMLPPIPTEEQWLEKSKILNLIKEHFKDDKNIIDKINKL